MMTKTRLWSLLVLIVGLTAAMVATGCGSDDSTSGTSGGGDNGELPLIQPGTLTVGSDIPFPPFEQGDAPDYEGFDIDLINAVADKMGVVGINDLPSVQDTADKLGGLEVVDNFPTDEQYGIIFPKGSTQLEDAVNEALQEVKDDGTLEDLYQKWFMIPAPEDLLQAGPAAALSDTTG